MIELKEHINQNEYHAHDVKRVHFDGETALQKVQIVEFTNYGKSMVLSGRIQSTQYDEFIYHESLVFAPYVHQENTRNVLSVGGANGGIAREVKKILSLEKLLIVDIDKEAMQIAKKHLSHMFPVDEQGVEHRFSPEPIKILDELESKWDIIINDFPDALSGSYSSSLYNVHYFSKVKRLLSDNGIAIFQLGSLNNYKDGFLINAYTSLQSVFEYVNLYTLFVPAFGASWILCMASSTEPRLVDEKFDETIEGLAFFDEISCKHMFSLPKYLRKYISEAKGIVVNDEIFQF